MVLAVFRRVALMAAGAVTMAATAPSPAPTGEATTAEI